MQWVPNGMTSPHTAHGLAIKESTKDLYAILSRRHLEPGPFGALGLDKLRPSDIDALMLGMRARTKRGKGEDAESVVHCPTRLSGRRTRFCGLALTERCVTDCWPVTPPHW